MNLGDFTEDEVKKIKENQREEKEFRKSLSKLLSGDSQVASKPLLIGVTPNAIDCCIKKKGLEYSGAAEPPFRKIGNRESGTGNRHTDIVTFASLLA